MANMPFLDAFYGLKLWLSKTKAGDGRPGMSGVSLVQQPLQIFFILAFIRASSALIVSTYFALSIFDAGPLFGAGPAGLTAADCAAGEAALS
jgi:hypothetical protein